MSTVDRMVSLDFSEVSQRDRYKLLIGAVVPRPIALVSTVSREGVGNLAPFSFFNAISSDPPCLMISITRKSGGDKKDTLKNIEATGEFVVNTVSEWLIEPVNQCSAEYPYGVSEMEKVGLTPEASLLVCPPRVKESPVQMECKLHKTLEVGDGNPGSAVIVVGEIVAMHVWDAAYSNGRILLEKIAPVARLAGTSYAKVAEPFSIPRPTL